MDAILENLQQQQIHLQQQPQPLYIDDLANMENGNRNVKHLTPHCKYVSVFRIDGEPILPPLMTSEKRRQMLKYKEKAIQIEERLRDSKQRTTDDITYKSEALITETSRSSLQNNTSQGNFSQRSQDYYDKKVKETEESMILLEDLLKRYEGGDSEEKTIQRVNTGCNTSEYSYQRDDENKEKLQKLQKSEILIYDNSTNEVIELPADKNQHKMPINCMPPKKPTRLLLAGVNSEGMTAIPTICLNPPTPLTVNKNMCESLSVSCEPNSSSHIRENLSSDEESLNSMRTHSDRKSYKNKGQNNNEIKTKPQPLTPTKNVSAKIKQFEAISSDSNTPLTSPEHLYKTRKSCLTAATGTISRSATSPSIKLGNSHRSASSRSQSLAPDSDNSPESSLIRSSSFTLECPSKVLIEHMQQQNLTNASKTKTTNVKSSLCNIRALPKKSMASPLRAYRDTVESKAKKVQKVDLKPTSKIRMQQKVTQSKLAQAATASVSPYNTTALTQKTKKSPYDLFKSSHSPQQTSQKAYSTQMRKSKSNSSNLAQLRTSKSRLSCSTSGTLQTANNSSHNITRTPVQNSPEPMIPMEASQKEKFQRLLAQQQEEHRRLQQSFEIQQKLLINQLAKEMAATQLKSSNNSSSLAATNQHKKVDSILLSPRLQNQLNLTGLSSDQTSTQNSSSHSNNYQIRRQPSPTSYISILNNSEGQSQSSPPSSSHHSHLLSIDHSNANTSLDISTYSTQTSPATVCATPTTPKNSFNNMVGHKLGSSTSRRRLFSEDRSEVAGDGNASPSTRFISSSTYATGHHFTEQGQSAQTLSQPNKIKTSINDSNRRPLAVNNSLILHNAATKINACARGFLVRRLFQTEQIQRIVQTIRDTLIFVINLHLDTMENPEESGTPANIKLKARLLQQTSVKERMEIIARDRKRIKTKLMSMNRRRTPRMA